MLTLHHLPCCLGDCVDHPVEDEGYGDYPLAVDSSSDWLGFHVAEMQDALDLGQQDSA